MEKLIEIKLTTTPDMSTIAVVLSCDSTMTADDVYTALKEYIEEFKEETVQ